MKTKNVILGIAALLFAVGGAFASMLTNPVEVSVKPVGEDFQCKLLQRECNDLTSNVCKIRVQTISGFQQATVWHPSGCVIPLFDSRPFIATIAPVELGETAIEVVE